MSYEPRPDSIAFRALAHMELLHKGSEINGALLAQAIGCPPASLSNSLQPALEAGLLFARKKGGHLRSPMFWSLADHSSSGMPAAVVSQLSKPVQRAIANGASVDTALSDAAASKPKRAYTRRVKTPQSAVKRLGKERARARPVTSVVVPTCASAQPASTKHRPPPPSITCASFNTGELLIEVPGQPALRLSPVQSADLLTWLQRVQPTITETL